MQHKGRGKRNNNASIQHAALHHLGGRTQQHAHRPYHCDADDCQKDPQQHGKAHHHAEVAVRLFLIAPPQLLRHLCRAAGADHEARTAQYHNKGENKVERRKFGFAYRIGNKQPIYHAVDGGKDHHDNGRHNKAHQPTVAEMVGKPDWLPRAISSLCVHLLFSSFHFLKFPANSFFAGSYGLYPCGLRRIMA